MSTVIQNGYYLDKRYMNLTKLQKFAKNVQKKLNRAQMKIKIEQKAAILQDIFVARHLYEKETFNRYIRSEYYIEKIGKTDTFDDLADRIIRKKQEMLEKKDTFADSTFHLECEMVFVPIYSKIMTLFYTKHKELFETWESFGDVHEYGYWNNTDKPKELTEKAWKERESDWKLALPGIGIPRENGFVFTVAEPLDWVKTDDVMEKITNHRDICLRHAENALEEEDNEKNPLPKDAPYHAYTRKYMAFKKWLKTDEGIECLETKTEEYIAKIPEKMTKESFYKPIFESL